ncbi:CD209 antigen-like protein B [Ostrea edulis]|uniref:CD209 antigen-like protein B n=1 Tax=Ostrea edulis TaxID=37623 RepID=UPI0024AFEAD1|nr:CD209 antigen-like protein B [Ostrea edulis]
MSIAALFMMLVIAQTSQGFSWVRGNRVCPRGWNLYGRHCYLFSKEKVNLKDAISKCADAVGSGRLAEVGGYREEKWLELQIKLRGMHDGVWMGASDILKENKFLKLSNARKIKYTNWNKGEPNNASKKEHCVEWVGNGKWNDNSCGKKNFFVCEHV